MRHMAEKPNPTSRLSKLLKDGNGKRACYCFAFAKGPMAGALIGWPLTSNIEP